MPSPAAQYFTKDVAWLPKGFRNKEEIALAARRCTKIINQVTGKEFFRPDPYDVRARWLELFTQAKFDKDTFVCEEEAEPKMVVSLPGEDGVSEQHEVYTKSELEQLGMTMLRAIGERYGAKDVSKSGIILKILQAQDTLVIKAREGR
jgi:hypothetical protein